MTLSTNVDKELFISVNKKLSDVDKELSIYVDKKLSTDVDKILST